MRTNTGNSVTHYTNCSGCNLSKDEFSRKFEIKGLFSGLNEKYEEYQENYRNFEKSIDDCNVYLDFFLITNIEHIILIEVILGFPSIEQEVEIET